MRSPGALLRDAQHLHFAPHDLQAHTSQSNAITSNLEPTMTQVPKCTRSASPRGKLSLTSLLLMMAILFLASVPLSHTCSEESASDPSLDMPSSCPSSPTPLHPDILSSSASSNTWSETTQPDGEEETGEGTAEQNKTQQQHALVQWTGQPMTFLLLQSSIQQGIEELCASVQQIVLKIATGVMAELTKWQGLILEATQRIHSHGWSQDYAPLDSALQEQGVPQEPEDVGDVENLGNQASEAPVELEEGQHLLEQQQQDFQGPEPQADELQRLSLDDAAPSEGDAAAVVVAGDSSDVTAAVSPAAAAAAEAASAAATVSWGHETEAQDLEPSIPDLELSNLPEEFTGAEVTDSPPAGDQEVTPSPWAGQDSDGSEAVTAAVALTLEALRGHATAAAAALQRLPAAAAAGAWRLLHEPEALSGLSADAAAALAQVPAGPGVSLGLGVAALVLVAALGAQALRGRRLARALRQAREEGAASSGALREQALQLRQAVHEAEAERAKLTTQMEQQAQRMVQDEQAHAAALSQAHHEHQEELAVLSSSHSEALRTYRYHLQVMRSAMRRMMGGVECFKHQVVGRLVDTRLDVEAMRGAVQLQASSLLSVRRFLAARQQQAAAQAQEHARQLVEVQAVAAGQLQQLQAVMDAQVSELSLRRRLEGNQLHGRVAHLEAVLRRFRSATHGAFQDVGTNAKERFSALIELSTQHAWQHQRHVRELEGQLAAAIGKGQKLKAHVKQLQIAVEQRDEEINEHVGDLEEMGQQLNTASAVLDAKERQIRHDRELMDRLQSNLQEADCRAMELELQVKAGEEQAERYEQMCERMQDLELRLTEVPKYCEKLQQAMMRIKQLSERLQLGQQQLEQLKGQLLEGDEALAASKRELQQVQAAAGERERQLQAALEMQSKQAQAQLEVKVKELRHRLDDIELLKDELGKSKLEAAALRKPRPALPSEPRALQQLSSNTTSTPAAYKR